MAQSVFGIVGLGVMGQNLALNVADRGFRVAGFDLDSSRGAALAKQGGGRIEAAGAAPQLTALLERPRRILIMVPAGAPVDAAIADLKPHLDSGDILIDGGNSFFRDTERRAAELGAAGIHFIGMGVSGGEEGARHGPSLMPGGPEAAYKYVEPVLDAIAANVDGEPCCAYIGKSSAGHYVKMVHNGIEYAIMQLICEAYDFMKRALGMSAAEMRDVFAAWNRTQMNSYLLEITAAVLGKTDSETGRPLVELILDRAGQKGTGKWTSQNAMDLGIAVPAINAALEARILSSLKDERVAAERVLGGPVAASPASREETIPVLRDALSLAIIAAYAQGFALMREASKEYGYNLRLGEIAKIWRGGCIIRANALNRIRAAFAAMPDLPNLLTSPEFAHETGGLLHNLRTAVSAMTGAGIPALGMCATLGYIDSYRTGRLPQNLLQAQRDYFGAHKYERVDRPRGSQYHTDWLE